MTASDLLELPGHAAFAGPEAMILAWLAGGAARFGASPALEGLGRPPLTHAALHATVAGFARGLCAAGIGRGDVVAVALPNGPEMLATLLGIASVAVALPLAPGDPAAEVTALLARLPIRLAIVEAGRRSGLRDTAAAAGLPVLELAADSAGPPRLPSAPPPAARPAQASGPTDAAIITRTAGTTREPKLVAWSQASLFASADVAARWMGLSRDDRSLCVMPFAHLHSVVRSCVPVLLRGGAVCCAPGFDSVRILGWIDSVRPTFMTAVPAILRTLLVRAEETGWRPPPGSLRLLASGSDAIDAATAEAITTRLGVPVREFYGMSEVSPMLAGSPPGKVARSGGTVGLPVPPWEVAVLDEAGRPLPPGQQGELAARGGLINPVLGAAPRPPGAWVRTGDLGRITPDGQIVVSGRVDNRLNRGGKKISPESVEEVLREHPTVREAAVFPIPESLLGERVGAVVVPAPGAAPEATTLRAFVAERLPDWMVPERLVIAPSIPRTATNKLARRSLAERLGVTWSHGTAIGRTAPTHETEARVASIVANLLEARTVDLDADLEEIGVESCLAVGLVVEIEERLGAQISPAEYVANRSVAGLARLVAGRPASVPSRRVRVMREGAPPPILFAAHGIGGGADYITSALHNLGAEVAVRGLAWHRRESDPLPESLESHARDYLPLIRAVQPHGPYNLCGHSFAGRLAFVIGQQLFEQGEAVAFCAIFDDEADQFRRTPNILNQPPPDNTTRGHCRHLLLRHVADSYPGDLWTYRAAVSNEQVLADPDQGWRELCCGTLHVQEVPGHHQNMTGEEQSRSWIGGFHATMVEAWKTALAAGPADVAARVAAARAHRARPEIALTTEARRAAKRGDIPTEIALYQRAIALTQSHPYWVYRNLGQALASVQDLSGAAAAFRAAADRERIPIMALAMLIHTLRRLGRRDEAAAALAEAFRYDAPEPAVQIALAEAERSAGQAEAALARLQRLWSEAPLLNVAWKFSGMLASRGRTAEALDVMRQAAALYPFAIGTRARITALEARIARPR